MAYTMQVQALQANTNDYIQNEILQIFKFTLIGRLIFRLLETSSFTS